MPCPSFRGAVSCGAVRSFEHAAVVVPGMIQVLVPGLFYVRVVHSSFCFLQLIVLSRSPCPPPPQKSHVLPFRTWHQQAHSRAISFAQAPLGIINSLFAPNDHGPLLSAHFTCFSCILPCASVAGGVSRPRRGVLCFLWNHTEHHQVLLKCQVPGMNHTEYHQVLLKCCCCCCSHINSHTH